MPLPEKNEIIFELKLIIKNNNEKFNELTDLILKLNTEINNNEEEIKNLQNEIHQIKDENSLLKNDINDVKEKETQFINENRQQKSDIALLKNEIKELKNENTQLKDENIQLKNEVNDIKEKFNILWSMNESKRIIANLDSKIIKENGNYNESLKNWINPSQKIKAELLYRLSDNGDSTLTFHDLCDNKGPTLTLFHVNDDNIVGIYTPLSWDSTSEWKNDMDTFILNLNKNQKYKKLKNDNSIYCNNSYGPYTNSFGFFESNTMKSIKYWVNTINQYYDNGSEILPRNKEKYDLIEIEVYKIIII